MADRHPYSTSTGYLMQTIAQFRKSFPATVSADTLKKLGLAPKNESYILNILRFLGLLDQDGNRTEIAKNVFSLQDNTSFAKEFEKLILTSYSDLFELRGDAAWKLDSDGLTTFFRTSDGTTEQVGKLQASTFRALANLSGQGEISEVTTSKPPSVSLKARTQKIKPEVKISGKATEPKEEEKKRDFGLTVRIEINLPADGSKETYDRIFKSIRDNLFDV